jgi:hypothetical protein
MAWLMYRALVNPLRTLLFIDQPYSPIDPPLPPNSGAEAEQGTRQSVCADTEEVGRMFPVDVRRLEGEFVQQPLAARAPVAVAAAVHVSGGLGGVVNILKSQLHGLFI